MSAPIPRISPRELHEAQLRGREPALLDVRTPAEYGRGHIPGARLIPLAALAPGALTRQFRRTTPGHEETLYITCRRGVRASEAATRLQQAGLRNLALVDGGTDGWTQAGLPLQRPAARLSLEQQFLVAAGGLVVLKVLLGFSLHELFFALAALPGAALIAAGTGRWHGMTGLLARLPWNRGSLYAA